MEALSAETPEALAEEMARTAYLMEKVRLSPYIPWEPTLKQWLFLLEERKDVMYGGAAGGGKTIAMLMAALMHVEPIADESQRGTQKYDALILRRTYADLALPGAPMTIADEWLTGTDAKRRDKGTKWEFPSGATLTFGYMQTDADRLRYQSSAFQFVGYDEASQFTETQLLYLFSRLRQSKESALAAEVPTRYRLCTNPGGPSHEYLKNRYVRPHETVPSRLFIPATMEENPHLNLEEYLENLAELDPFTRAQLEAGDWDVEPSGNFFLNNMPVLPLSQSEGSWGKRAQRCRAWDLAATATGDYAVGVLVARDRAARKYRVEDVVRVRAEPAQIEKVMKATAERDGTGIPQVIERETGSAGKFAMRDIRHRIFSRSPVFEVAPTGNKMTRARLAASLVAAGDVELAPGAWNAEFVSELVGFPTGKHDDQVDALSHGIHWLVRTGGQDKPKNPMTQSQDEISNKRKRLAQARLRIIR